MCCLSTIQTAHSIISNARRRQVSKQGKTRQGKASRVSFPTTWGRGGLLPTTTIEVLTATNDNKRPRTTDVCNARNSRSSNLTMMAIQTWQILSPRLAPGIGMGWAGLFCLAFSSQPALRSSSPGSGPEWDDHSNRSSDVFCGRTFRWLPVPVTVPAWRS